MMALVFRKLEGYSGRVKRVKVISMDKESYSCVVISKRK